MSHIRSLAEKLNPTDNPEDVWTSALKLLPLLDLKKVVFLDLSNASKPIVRSNAGCVWDLEYQHSVASGDDPFAANCLSSIAPMLTGIGHFENHNYLSDDSKSLIAQGSEALGIQTGMSVTIRPHPIGAGVGWNLMTNFTVREFQELRAENEADWRAWCQLTYAGLTANKKPIDHKILTARERDCLAYIADGYRTANVAHQLGIAETTVEMHLRSARQKLGSKTRDHAVAMAVRKGWI